MQIQQLGVSAWLALAEGKKDEALTLMREAADREDKTEKNAVTPGPIAPAREQLGYMLLELSSRRMRSRRSRSRLKKEPNRYRALAGAAEAAAPDERATAEEQVRRTVARRWSVAATVRLRPEVAAREGSAAVKPEPADDDRIDRV